MAAKPMTIIPPRGQIGPQGIEPREQERPSEDQKKNFVAYRAGDPNKTGNPAGSRLVHPTFWNPERRCHTCQDRRNRRRGKLPGPNWYHSDKKWIDPNSRDCSEGGKQR
jgi:hypothetical protein